MNIRTVRNLTFVVMCGLFVGAAQLSASNQASCESSPVFPFVLYCTHDSCDGIGDETCADLCYQAFGSPNGMVAGGCTDGEFDCVCQTPSE